MKHRTRLAFTIGIAIAAIAALAQASCKGKHAKLCSSDRFPQGNSFAQCCQDENRTWHTNNAGVFVYRTYGEPCREEDGVGVNCGEGSVPFKPCTYGPCRAKNEWLIVAESAYVFHPTKKKKQCGWSVDNIIDVRICTDPGGCGQLGETRYDPEPYTGQQLYGGVTGTCPYPPGSRCLVGGIPAPAQ